MSHGDLVVEAPAGFTVDGTSDSCPISAMSNEERNFMQFNSIQRFIILNMAMRC